MALNPDLVSAIERTIGAVRIINAGEPLAGNYYWDVRDSRWKLKIIRRGETYLSNCPCCSDQRGRLSINHRYGLRDARTGDRGTNLWKCYNDECQHEPEYRAKLRGMLLPELDIPYTGIRFRVPHITETSATELEPCEFPGSLVSLRELPEDHIAIRYLRRRNYDSHELVVNWDVGYAESVPSRSREAMAQDRLIIPVHQRGVMVGWQARFVGELDWKRAGIPKYLTYFPKSLTLYGMDQAKDAPYLVLCEGAFDVWRFGPGAVCGFGKSLSADQARLLVATLQGRPLLLMPDANDRDAFDKFCKGMELVLQAGHTGKYGIAPLPLGKDPATMSRRALHELTDMAVISAAN